MDKSKLMMIIIIVLLVLLLGTVVAVSFFLINMGGSNEPTVGIEHLPPDQVRLRDLYPIYLGDDQITTHLAEGPTGRTGNVRANVIAGIDTTGDQREFEEFVRDFNVRISMARSIAIEVLNGLTYEEIRTPEGQNAASEAIMRRLQENFESPLIVNIRFSNWVVNQRLVRINE